MRAAIYARVSTEEQASHGTSIGTQVERCRAHIEQRNWELVDEYIDAGKSGTLANRPELDRLMADARAGIVEAVVVTKLDRFGRSSRHLHNALGDLGDWGVKFVSLAESFDTSTPFGEFSMTVLAGIAALDRNMTVAKLAEGARAVARQGYWPGGPAPFGLRRVRSESHTTLEIDDDEAEVIRTATRLVLEEGCSLAEATARLNALDLHPRRAARWDRQNLRRALKQTYLMGNFVFAKQAKPGYRRYGKHGPEIDLAVPSILSAQEFGALQKVLGATRRGPVRNRRVYMLSGRFFGLCGSTFSGVWRNYRGWRQYRCLGARHEPGRPRCEDRHRVHADFIEDLVWSEVARLLSEPDRLIAMANDFMGLQAEHLETEQDQIAAIDGKIASLERAVANGYAEGLKAGIDGEALKQAVAELNDELGAARRHRVQLESWRADQEAESSRMRQLWELAEVAHQRLASMTVEEKRAVLALLDVRVHVQGYDPLRVHIEGFVKDGLSLDAAREPARVGPQGLEPCPPD